MHALFCLFAHVRTCVQCRLSARNFSRPIYSSSIQVLCVQRMNPKRNSVCFHCESIWKMYTYKLYRTASSASIRCRWREIDRVCMFVYVKAHAMIGNWHITISIQQSNNIMNIIHIYFKIMIFRSRFQFNHHKSNHSNKHQQQQHQHQHH